MSMLAHQVRADQLIFWRGRESAVFVFLFPVLLFLLLSTVYDGEYRGRPLTDYLVPALITYGVANTAFGGLAITLVVRRELGRAQAHPRDAAARRDVPRRDALLDPPRLRAPGDVDHGARRACSTAGSFPAEWPSLLLSFVLGAICFAGMGFGAAALIRSAEGASAVVNVIVLPMTFLAGGFGPTRDFPAFLQAIADVLPLTYLIDLVEGAVYRGEPIWEQPQAVLVLLAWGVAGLVIAARWFGWEPRER